MSWGRVPTCRPYQECPSVSPALEVCHDAVDNVRFRRDEVDGVNVGLGLAPVGDVLDVYAESDQLVHRACLERTRNVGIENVILLDHIVDELAAVIVHDQDLPLGGISTACGMKAGDRTSPRVVLRIVLRITVRRISGAHAEASWRARILSLCMSIIETPMTAGSFWQPAAHRAEGCLMLSERTRLRRGLSR